MVALSIKSLWRYPVKGLGGEALPQATVLPGRGLAGDRRWILAFADAPTDEQRAWKRGHTLKTNPRLAKLQARLFEDGTLEIAADAQSSSSSVRGIPTQAAARQKIEQFAADFLQDPDVHLADCEQQPAWDYPEAQVSVLFEDSVNCFSQQGGHDADVRRFRANILLSGGGEWAENQRGGDMLRFASGVVLRTIEPIPRCRAVNVNPDTAVSDMRAAETLLRLYGHNTMGIKCAVINGGEMQLGEHADWQCATQHA